MSIFMALNFKPQRPMNKYFTIFALCIPALFSVSCQDRFQDEGPVKEEKQEKTVLTSLTARMGDKSDSRTVLREDDGKLLWSEYDYITVFAGDGSEGYSFKADVNAPSSTATFKGEANLSDMDEDDWLYSVYPEIESDLKPENGQLPVIINGDPYKYDEMDHRVVVGAVTPHTTYQYPMVARSKDENLTFYNVCGGIRFTVANSHIISVVFKDKEGKPVSGTARVAFDEDGLPQITRWEDGCDELWSFPNYEDSDYSYFNPGEPFYAILPARTYAEGMTVTFRTPSTEATYEIDRSFDIKRSVFSQLKERDKDLEFKPVEGNMPFYSNVFKEYCVANFDTNGDGEISYAEALAVTAIRFYETDKLEFDFGSLSELMYFENLTRLDLTPSEDMAHAGHLGYLDLQHFPKLRILRCYSNQISKLDFSHSPEMYYLDIGGNDFYSLDLSSLSKLEIFYCRNAGLQQLSLRDDSILRDMWVDRNHLEEINVGHQGALSRIRVDSNKEMTSLDLSNCPAMATVLAEYCNLEEIQLPPGETVQLLDLEGNKLNFLNLEQNRGIEYLYISWNYGMYYDPRPLTNLKELYIEGMYVGFDGYVSIMDLSGFPLLEELVCDYNYFETLDLSHNPNLSLLSCSDNHLEGLDLKDNPALKTLKCGDNYFSTINVSKNLQLESLDVSSWREGVVEGYEPPHWTIYVAPGQTIPNLTAPASAEIVVITDNVQANALNAFGFERQSAGKRSKEQEKERPF